MQVMGDRIGQAVGLLRRNPLWSSWILAIFLAVLSVNAARIIGAETSSGILARGSRSDFDDYFQAARGLQAGEDVYRVTTIEELRATYSLQDLNKPEVFLEIARRLRGVGSYLYPPLLAFALGPLTQLTYAVAALVFQLSSVLTLVAFFAWVTRRKLVAAPEAPALFVCATFLCLEFLRGNVGNGNIGSFLILLLAPGLVFSFHKHIGVAILGGVLIGIATTLKVTPVFLGLVLLGGRRFAALFGAVAGGVFGLLVPAIGLGFDANLAHLGHWYSIIIKNFGEAVFVRPWANNQTVSAALAKLLVPNADPDQSLAGLPLLADPSQVLVGRIRSLARFTNLSLYAAAAVAALRMALIPNARRSELDSPERGGPLLDLTTGVLLVSLVGSGVSWYHAYCLLLIPIVWRLAGVFAGSRPRFCDVFLWSVFGLFSGVESLLPGEIRRVIALTSLFAFFMLAASLLHLWRSFWWPAPPRDPPARTA